ncbi:hypothetical protein MTR67_019007 [Solanum verrucosum]|uniref:Reverse transcriptase zinc-binding domain-containing protein n=1 Tax=Solanum verrucosum TaxID=315347 RepID=A0AAF0QMV7_SOLVR|nr:hypothetical protein MTR67_019007 [Solanum verrucosum]
MAASDKQNTLDYINQMFPTEASLSGVEPLMQKIHSEIRRVDAEILTAVRQQSNSGTKAREDLAAATSAVQELMNKIREIKTKAEQSETMVQEICRDIKKLDFAKKHITTTITALHRLTMLACLCYPISVLQSLVHPVEPFLLPQPKYGELNPWCTEIEIVLEPYGWGVWRTIRVLWISMEENVFLKVGNGNKIKFWRDGWIDQIPLSESIPDLFSICNNPEARVCECWTTQGWDLSFRRLLNDWEVDRVASFLGKLGGANLVTNAPDRVIWKHNKDVKFTVNSAYKKGIQVGVRGSHHHWKSIWRGLIPTKVKCFTWLVIKRACLTQEVLQKKGKQLVPRCFLCNLTGETNKHLFLHLGDVPQHHML